MQKFQPTLNQKVFLLLAFIALLGYMNVVNGPFLFDDEHFIVRNTTIHLINLKKIFSTSTTEGSLMSGAFYRPLQQLVFAINYHFFELNPVPFHLTSIAFHILNAYLLFLLLQLLGFSVLAGMIGSIIFVIHPVQTEPVSSMCSLSDPMSTFFVLSGVLLFAKGVLAKQPNQYWIRLSVSCLMFISGFLTRESAVVCLPICFFVGIFLYIRENKEIDKNFITALGIIFIATLIYIFIKFKFFNFNNMVGLTDEKNIYTENLWVRLNTFVCILWDYFKLIVYPKFLYYEKPYLAYVSVLNLRALFGYLLSLIFLLSCIFVKRVPLIFLGLGCFFAGLLPYMGIIPLNAIYLEHWLYIPMIGVVILVAAFIDHNKSKNAQNVILIVFSIVFVLMAGRTISRNTEWGNIEKFYLNELKFAHDSARMLNNLGMYYDEAKDFEKAIYYYQKAADLPKKFPNPHHNMANVYQQMGQINMAINELYKALKIDPNFSFSLKKLYVIYASTGKEAKARRIHKLIEKLYRGGRNTWDDIKVIQ